MKNIVEAQPRKFNKKNRVVEPIRDDDVKHSLLNANSELICATCNKCMFDGIPDMCLLDFVKNVNGRAKSAKKHKKQKIWKPTGHVFTEVGLKWKPIVQLDSRERPYCKDIGYGDHQLDAITPNFVQISPDDNAKVQRLGASYGIIGYHISTSVLLTRFLRTKDEAPEAIIKCIKNKLVRLNATVRNVRTDNETEFVNQTLHEFYENVGITHQTSVARTPQQNSIVERQNRTLVEAARTMLIFLKALLFLWAEAINTACYTQNHSIIIRRYNKTPYELMQYKKLDLSFFHVFGALCYPTDS
ncbi:retrovirus-related pol polyprotein from transposon TNT 1-94 [Tanacetum coccineum]|uniref:Retrovirus-related pol polyprotein from transposon TNT 1-94 n=1 Tax=Tanacetum coccineum TaxID=301880 RepID=A0ABQ5J1B2_9ASTR